MNDWEYTLRDQSINPTFLSIWRKIDDAYYESGKPRSEILKGLIDEIKEQRSISKLGKNSGIVRSFITNDSLNRQNAETFFPFVVELIERAHNDGIILQGKYI